MPRICLIIDNPLRDLDGLCLIAWHLSQSGAEVFLVPMHMQGFDIPSLKPDAILANYVRANNLDLLKLYKQQGSHVAILDTEGVGEWWPKHAQLLKDQGVEAFVDEYYCWGEMQSRILSETGSLPSKRIKVTGCPRYDFIAQPWRMALPENDLAPGYILINTNFPVVNPQYEKNSSTEIKGWVKVGWGTKARAESFANASKQVFEGVKQAVKELAQALPDRSFVLRPHPFESMAPYQALAETLPNLKLRKQGTSLQWINHAKALLHVNCFTGIEAGFMQVEALGFEWVNHQDLRQYSSEPFLVTRNASNLGEMVEWLERLYAEQTLDRLPLREEALSRLISANYRAIDGQSAKRVAQELLNLANRVPLRTGTLTSSVGNRQRLARRLRQGLGFKGADIIKKLITPTKIRCERKLKIPSVETVAEILRRIQSASGSSKCPIASSAVRENYHRPHQASFRSVRIAIP